MTNRLDTNEQTFLQFLDQYKGDRNNDLMSIADQSERLDYLSNLTRNCCVLLTGSDFKALKVKILELMKYYYYERYQNEGVSQGPC